MNIMLCFDDMNWNYTRHAAVTILSLLETNKKNHIKIFIISSKISDDNISELKRIVNLYNQEIEFIISENIIPDDLKNVMINKNNLTRWVRYRWFFPKFIKWIDRLLSIDCDVLVMKDLKWIYNMDMKWKAIAWYFDAREWQGNFFDTKNYINAWVLLFDVSKYNMNKITVKKLEEINKKYSKYFTGSDQDKINIIFKDDIIIWPSWMNYQIVSKHFNNIFHKWLDSAEIIHCIRKPYLKYSLIPDRFVNIYNNYLDSKKWKWFPLDKPKYWFFKYQYICLRDILFNFLKLLFWWEFMYKLMMLKTIIIRKFK